MLFFPLHLCPTFMCGRCAMTFTSNPLSHTLPHPDSPFFLRSALTLSDQSSLRISFPLPPLHLYSLCSLPVSYSIFLLDVYPKFPLLFQIPQISFPPHLYSVICKHIHVKSPGFAGRLPELVKSPNLPAGRTNLPDFYQIEIRLIMAENPYKTSSFSV